METPKEKEIDWQFCQVFGEPHFDDVTEVDIVSSIEFDSTGDYLAAGDRGGRVVIFQRVDTEDTPCEYKFHAEFQSHEPEFDYLKSLEIEEKINQIKWCPTKTTNSLLVMTTNDKTIKLWKVYDKNVAVDETPVTNGHTTNGPAKTLKLPSVRRRERQKNAVVKRVFANAHAYHINSISLNSDNETYISADDLRINLWNLEISNKSFNIVDIKPTNMEELTEVITAAEFHPNNCQTLAYSSSKGTIKLIDMRSAALCDAHAKRFDEEEDPSQKTFFSEIIASISDLCFSSNGNYILSRDYLTLKLWDIRKEDGPAKTIRIHDFLKSKLCDLYENDCIFDKFECCMNKGGDHVMTGSYHNYFQVYDVRGEKAKQLRIKLGRGATRKTDTQLNADDIDHTKKVLHVAWHPWEDIIAVAANNNLYLYAGKK